MDRIQFENLAQRQNVEAAAKVVEARETKSACVVVEMLAFGGVPYCTAHRVMGACTFGGAS